MSTEAQKLTFAEHIQEVRKRLMWSLLFVAIGAGVGYALHTTILNILQQPLNNSLYYTAPTGAFSFVIKVCVVFGLILALPVVVYQFFAFFGPLLPKKTKKSITLYVFVSVLLAGAGIAFAYFISLPAALHFLVNFGSDGADIQAIITADEYFNFVLAYIAGFAILFQLPLVILFINRVTPLKPSQLMGGTRYVILGSFIVAAIITPTPDPLNQALMAGPIILLYFGSVVIVALANITRSNKKPKTVGVPITSVVKVEPVLADTRSLHIEPTPRSNARPITGTTHNAQPVTSQSPARRRLVTDMVSAPHEPLALDPAVRRRQTAPVQPASPRQPVQTGVISDFIPAVD